MGTLSKISFLVFKRNKGFSIGLFVLLILSSALIFVACTLPDTVSKTIYSFLDEYRIPQAWINTDVKTGNFDSIKTIHGIKNAESEIVYEDSFYYGKNSSSSMLFLSVEDNTYKKYYFQSQTEKSDSKINIWLSAYFANSNKINVGDAVKVNTPYGVKECMVQALVSSPESIRCCRDEHYCYDGANYGYVFVPRPDFDKLFNTYGLYNNINIWFNDNTSIQDQTTIMDNLKHQLGSVNLADTIYEESDAKYIIESNIEVLFNTCTYLPAIIIFIVIGCSLIFTRQIIFRQNKTLILLRSLGYSKTFVILSLVFYVVVVNIIAILTGLLIGYFLSTFAAGIYKSIFCLPYLYMSSNAYLLTILVSILFFIDIICVLLSFRNIVNTDPVLVNSSKPIYNTLTNNIKRVFKSFYLNLASLFINRKLFRYILTVLCLSACIVLTIIFVGSLMSKNYVVNSTFKDRFLYDCTVYFDDNKNICNEISQVNNVSTVEATKIFSKELSFNDNKVKVNIHALDENSKMEHPLNISRNIANYSNGIAIEEFLASSLNIHVGDQVDIEGKKLKVTDVAREGINNIQYVDMNTASLLGCKNINACFVKFSDVNSYDDGVNAIRKINGFTYMTRLDKQQFDMRESTKALDYIFYTFIFCAFFTGLLIILNMIILNINHREYDYSVLKVLGFYRREFFIINIIENFSLYILAILISCPLGYYALDFVLHSMSSKRQSFPLVDPTLSIIISCGIAFIYIVVGVAYTMYRIKKIDFVKSLNAKE